jgi:hypothetical protein
LCYAFHFSIGLFFLWKHFITYLKIVLSSA